MYVRTMNQGCGLLFAMDYCKVYRVIRWYTVQICRNFDRSFRTIIKKQKT